MKQESNNGRKGQVNNPEGHNQYTKKDSSQSKGHSNNPEGHNQYTKNNKNSK